MTLARIKKGDMVQIMAGREKGKTGKVLELLAREERILVERLNMVKRHLRPQKSAQQGGIVEKEAPIAIAAVLPFCPKCNRGVRVAIKVGKDKAKHRVCAQCEGTLEGKK